MSKKKRLGRGLEALLGVGKPLESTKPNPPGDPTSEIDANVESELGTREADAEPAESAEPDEPTILKFDRSGSASDGVATSDPYSSTLSGTDPSDLKPAEVSGSAVASTPSDDSNPGPLIPEDVRMLNPKRNASSQIASIASDVGSSSDPGTAVVELNVYDVDDNPFQPRREFNKSEIESLAESLKTHEQLQPILVRKVDDRYQLISGERRLRAAIHAGWSKIRAQVREADDRLVAELAIVENLQRKDLNPIEKALSFRRYVDEHQCSHEDLAGRLKIDRSTVANLLRLLELPEVVQKAIQIGIISNGHARALLPLGEEHLQIEFCNRIQREGLSVRAIEQMVRDRIDEEDGIKSRSKKAKGRTKSNQVVSLENELRNALGTKIEIKPSSRGKGKIVVHYTSREEFERLRELFGDSSGSNRDAA